MPPEYTTKEMCDQKHTETMEAIDGLRVGLDQVSRRLFQDNGKKSIQTIIAEHSQVIKVITWLGMVIATGFIGQIILFIVLMVKHVL